MTQQSNEKPQWFVDSILFKTGIITVIMLVLLIPSSWIQGLVADREGYQQQMMQSVADKWSGSQLVQGPVLMLPYRKLIKETEAGNKTITREIIKTIYVLPQALQIKANVTTVPYARGVYNATVYNAGIAVTGNFGKPELVSLGIDSAAVLYDKARLVFSISDLKGLKNNPQIKINEQTFIPEPSTDNQGPFDKGLQVNFNAQNGQGFNFSYRIDLRGINELKFLQTAKTTNVEISGDWMTPDFNIGRYLPDTSNVSNAGFKARWQMPYYNRQFPQQWVDNRSLLTNSAAAREAVFGVRLQVPIDQYRKILRTTKYDTLIILLTFVSLFLTELIRKQKVHLFNYLLIGAAMIVYYTLLLSFAEQIGFNYAYLLASAATIALISVFTASLMNNKSVAVLFALILSVFYGFIFVIIQLEELSLLFGSIALFLIVATLMYFSRKIDWDKH
jgi:inner membrane protein